MTSKAARIIKWGPIVIFFGFIILYTIYGAKHLIFGIKIEDMSIVDGATVEDSAIQVTGVAKDAIKITLNGREITIDQQGKFNDIVALLPGYNILNIRAADKFGYMDEKNYQLIRVIK